MQALLHHTECWSEESLMIAIGMQCENQGVMADMHTLTFLARHAPQPLLGLPQKTIARRG